MVFNTHKPFVHNGVGDEAGAICARQVGRCRAMLVAAMGLGPQRLCLVFSVFSLWYPYYHRVAPTTGLSDIETSDSEGWEEWVEEEEEEVENDA